MKMNIEVPALARVEGEGVLYIRLKDGKINQVELNIYEPPRFFDCEPQPRLNLRR